MWLQQQRGSAPPKGNADMKNAPAFEINYIAKNGCSTVKRFATIEKAQDWETKHSVMTRYIGPRRPPGWAIAK